MHDAIQDCIIFLFHQLQCFSSKAVSNNPLVYYLHTEEIQTKYPLKKKKKKLKLLPYITDASLALKLDC